MLKKCLWGGVLLAAAAVGLLTFPQHSQAQHFGLGGRGGYMGGFGGYGGYGMGNSVYYGNWGMPGYYGSGVWGIPGGYGMNYGTGWTTPYYSNYTAPTYAPGYVNYNWNTPSTAYVPSTTSTYQSFYPPQNNSAAHVTVHVPDPKAQLWFNGTLMPEGGTVREFNTPPLANPKEAYHYAVRAHWTQDGRPIDYTRTVYVHPGQQVMVDFTQQPAGNYNTRPAVNANPGAAVQQPENLKVPSTSKVKQQP